MKKKQEGILELVKLNSRSNEEEEEEKICLTCHEK